MKKTNFIPVVIAFLMFLCFTLCLNGCGGDTHGSIEAALSSLQGQIDAAAAGSTVTLNPAYSGDSITISSAVTVNGSGIENLSIIVNADVADDVTLTNFANASITVTDGSRRARFARAADGDGDGDDDGDGEAVKPKDLGDDNAKLRLEDCTIEKITADEDFTLYLDRDDKKVEIEELELKGDDCNFVVIGADNEDDPADKKSTIEKLTIDAGVDEIDLVGAYFEDIDFKGEFDEKVDLYFEKDVDERLDLDVDAKQISDDFKDKVEEAATKVAAKDVCNVKNGSGIYKVTFPKNKIPDAKGAVFIMLLRDDQKTAYLNSIHELAEGNNTTVNGPGEGGWNWATKAHPYFDIRYTGAYIFSDQDGVHTVSGDTDKFYHYVEGQEDYYEYYDNYLSYSKDALCTSCDGTNVTVYLNMENLKKSDLDTCAYKEDGYEDEYYLTPNKLTEIDLEGYTPYIALDFLPYCKNVRDGNEAWDEPTLAAARSYFGTPINEWHIQVPVSKNNNYTDSFQYVFMFPMTAITAAEYPDVSAVDYDVYQCPPPPANE